MSQTLSQLTAKAESLAAAVTSFYAAAVGRRMDWNAEWSLLSDWREATELALRASIKAGSTPDADAMRTLLDQCRMFLELSAEAA